MKQGEIYLIQCDPSVGHEFQKARPAIVLSSEKTMEVSSLVTFVAITKTTRSPMDDDIPIQKDSKNRLMFDSLIKVHHISSFDKSRVINYIGEVHEGVLLKIKTYLKKHFEM